MTSPYLVHVHDRQEEKRLFCEKPSGRNLLLWHHTWTTLSIGICGGFRVASLLSKIFNPNYIASLKKWAWSYYLVISYSWALTRPYLARMDFEFRKNIRNSMPCGTTFTFLVGLAFLRVRAALHMIWWEVFSYYSKVVFCRVHRNHTRAIYPGITLKIPAVSSVRRPNPYPNVREFCRTAVSSVSHSIPYSYVSHSNPYPKLL